MTPSRKRLIAALAFALPVAALVAPPAMAKQQTQQSQSHKSKSHASSKSKSKHAHKGSKAKKPTTAAS